MFADCKNLASRSHRTDLEVGVVAYALSLLSATSVIQSASLRILTPSSAALRAFDPASEPATRKSVFAETDPDTLAPMDSALALASARDIADKVPVKTIVLLLMGLLSAGRSGGSAVTSLARSVNIA